MSQPTQVNWRFYIGLLLGIWALIGLQRLAPSALAPYIMSEFSLDYKSFGLAMGLLGITWSMGSFVSGLFVDRRGAKPTIVVAAAASAIFGWLSGAAVNFASFLGVRAVLGFAEGAVWAPITKTGSKLVPETLRARLIAMFFAAFLIVGMVLGGAILPQIAEALNWRWGFFLAAVPLGILTFVLWKFMPEAAPAEDLTHHESGEKISPFVVLKERNVFLCAVVGICGMARFFVVVFFASLFLTGVHELTPQTAGMIIAAAFVGEIVGGLTFGTISDRIGQRRIVVIGCAIASAVCGLLLWLLPAGTPALALTVVMFAFIMFGGAISPLVVGVIPGESVDPRLAGTSVGVTNGISEFVGGALFPIIAGILADLFGVQVIVLVAACAMGVAALAGLLLRETGSGRPAQAEQVSE